MIFGCDQSVSENEETVAKEVETFTYGEPGFRFSQFSDAAGEQIENWGVLHDLLEEIRKVEGSSYMNIRSRAENIRQYTDSVFNSTPEGLSVNPVISRMLILKTRAELLFQTSHLGTIDTAQIQQSIRSLNRATEHLILQLNEKALKDRIYMERRADEEKERLSQVQFRDSVTKSKKND